MKSETLKVTTNEAEPSEFAWPQGYCLDPNGKMCCPEAAEPHWSFGYEIGYREAFATLSRASFATQAEPSDKAEIEHLRACANGIGRSGMYGMTQAELRRLANRIERASLATMSPQPSEVQELVNEQAEDAGLWFVAQHASEAYLQTALRDLHRVIERAALGTTGEPKP